MRGNPVHPHAKQGQTGSIPACAGEPNAGHMFSPLYEVYPRVCGGTGLPMKNLRVSSGLSPRVRGNLDKAVDAHLDTGSIPACAGEPRRRARWNRKLWVYPRVCGGTQVVAWLEDQLLGLSPRVRGNPTAHCMPLSFFRSIPACAGEPPAPAPARPARRVYPRVCGGTAITM